RHLREMAQGDASLERELVALLVTDTRARIARMESAIRTGDALALAREAHTVRGAGGNVGASRLAEIPGRLERHCSAAEFDSAAALVVRLSLELEGLEREEELHLSRCAS